MGCVKLNIFESVPAKRSSQILMGSLSNCKPIIKKCVSTYRFGFNGQEQDKELKGNGNSLNFKFRMYDSRVGRFYGIDPIARQYPFITPYNFAENDVIRAIDLWGLQKLIVDGIEWTRASTKLEISIAESDFYLKRRSVAKKIGVHKYGSTNISSVAGRTALNIAGPKENKILTEGEGTQRNALRHVIWSASINSKFGNQINFEATNVHEGISIDASSITIDWSTRFKGSLKLADHIVDLLNNEIGRSISNHGDGMTNFEIGAKALEVFMNEGLYEATKNDDESYSISRNKISTFQYSEAMRRIVNLDENGFTPGQQEEINNGDIEINDDAY